MISKLSILLYTLPFIRNVLKLYRQSDYILCAPGGMNLGGFQDWLHVAFLDLAVKERKKVIYFARSIGPFKTKSYRWRLFKQISINLMKSFKYISLRDNLSQKFADDLGITYIPTLDSAFLERPSVEIPKIVGNELKVSDYIVLIPNSLTWHSDFKCYSYENILQFWICLTNKILFEYKEYKIVMLPQTIGHSKILADGYIYFSKIKDKCDYPQRVIILDEKYGSDIQQTIISGSKFLIGARYHSIIFAINQNVPFVSLSYEHKMTGVLDILGLNNNEIVIKDGFDMILKNQITIEGLSRQILDKMNSLQTNENKQQQAFDIARRGLEELDYILN